MANKQEQLQELHDQMAADEELQLQESNLVFGEGDPDGEICFIGEAPGAKEDELIRPFVGRGGQLLTKELERVGIKREDVYITNIVKRRPPDNRDPSPEEIAAYAPYLKKQLAILDPLVIIPLGRFSMNYYLPHAKITKDQGKIFQTDGKLILPMLHPAAALRNPGMKKMFVDTFTKLSKSLEACREFKRG